MEKNNDGKDKYRKKKYTPKKVSQDSRSESLLNWYIKKYKKGLKVSKELQKLYEASLKFKQEDPSFVDSIHSHIVSLALDVKAFEILVDAGKKGANLSLIYDTLPHADKNLPPAVNDMPFIALIDRAGAFNKQYPEALKKYEAKRKDYIKKEKAISAAVKLLCNLPAISEDIKYRGIHALDLNRDLFQLQTQLKIIINDYLDLLAMDNEASFIYEHWGLKDPRKWKKRKYKNPNREASDELNKIIITLVDEFKRIGYSDKQAYTKTGTLLHCSCSHICKDPDPDLIRQRYAYHKKK